MRRLPLHDQITGERGRARPDALAAGDVSADPDYRVITVNTTGLESE